MIWRFSFLWRVLASVRMAWRVYRDPRTPRWAKVALTVPAVAYVLWPADVVPLVVPVLGLLDDAALVTLVGWLITRIAPASVRREHRAAVGLAAREGERGEAVREAV